MSVIFPTEIYQRETIPVEKQTLELGNSDRIQLKFGNYGIEVLESVHEGSGSKPERENSPRVVVDQNSQVVGTT